MPLPCRLTQFSSSGNLLIGIGNRIELHQENSGASFADNVLRPGSSIVGASSNEALGKKWVVWGERSLSVLSTEGEITVTAKLDCKDWICAVAILTNKPDSCERIAVLSAHLKISMYSSNDNCLEEESSYQCIVKCTLFSGLLHGNSWTELLAATGTAFGEVILWKPCLSSKPKLRLTGHSGVVFDLALCPELSILASVSDDRTLRVWQFSNDSFTDLENSYEGYGHQSRPWTVSVSSSGLIVTSGEDSFICLWMYQKEIKSTECLKLWKRLDTQDGSIRALDYSPEENALCFGSDGGAVGRIKLAKTFESVQYLHFPPLGKTKLLHVLYGNDSGIIFLRNSGHIDVRDSVTLETKNLHQYAFNSLSQISFSRSDHHIAIGSVQGTFGIFDEKNATWNGWLTDLFDAILHVVIVQTTETILRFLICRTEGRMQLVAYSRTENKFWLEQNYRLPRGKQQWSSAALILSGTPRNSLVVGDRNGSVYLYSSQQPEPVQCFRKIHGKHGVTDFYQCPKTRRLHSLGRDGVLRSWRLSESTQTLSLVQERKLSIEWPARFITSPSRSENTTEALWIAGFCANKFTLIDAVTEHSFCEIECGGGRRSWDISLSDSNCKLLFLKEGTPFIASSHLWKIDYLKESSSKLKINSLASINSGSGSSFVVTAGEDTTVSIIAHPEGSLPLVKQKLLGHISSIQCCCSIPESTSFVTGGGRDELKIWDFDCEINKWVPSGKPLRNEDSVENTSTDAKYISVDSCSLPLHISKYFVAASRSDGLLRVFGSVEDQGKCLLTFRPNSNGISFCLSSIKIRRLNDCLALFGVDTAGNFHWFQLVPESNQNEPEEQKLAIANSGLQFLERTGICSLDVDEWKNDSRMFGVAGSESGKLHSILFSHSGELNFGSVEPHCHASTVTDICIESAKGLFVSISTDQRFCVWSYSVHGNEVKVELLQYKMTTVGDPLAVVCLPNKYVVAGCGIDEIECFD